MLRAPLYSHHYNKAMGSTQPYRGTDHTVAEMIRLMKGPRGEQSVKVRRHTEQIIRHLRPKDYTSEMIAICKWWGNAGRYTRDPVHVEMLRDPERLVDDALQGRLSCDCFPAGTLLLRDDYRLVPIEALEPGDRIWGENDWSLVEDVSAKGLLSLDAIRLNTGSWMHLTPGHKVYVVLPSGAVERIRVSDMQEGMVLLSPDKIAFGEGDDDPDLCLLDGLYLSDGWTASGGYGIHISGKDGCPKEEQKREVEKIAKAQGWNTSWRDKDIAVWGAGVAERMSGMGKHAPEKVARSLDLGEAQAASLLRGIMADSGLNTGPVPGTKAVSRTFSSTSRELAIQVRVLHKMFGIRMSMRRLDDHGGLGENPIYRLGQRLHPKWHPIRVKEIVRGVRESECYDVTTSDHKVYLPAHDVTVSNCDEYATAIGSACLAVGLPVEVLTVGFSAPAPGRPKIHTHVFVRAQDPRTKKWYVLDPVAGRRTKSMLKRVKQHTRFAME